MQVSVRTLVAVLGLQLLLGGLLVFFAVNGFPFVGGAEEKAEPERPVAFDSGRAMAEVRRQVALGPRPAGSPASRRLAERLRRRLPGGRFEPVRGHPGLRNVVGRLAGRRPAVLLAAHYDTKDLPGFVGANDGAAGTAVVLEVARVLARTERPAGAPEVRFVLFDGEESPRGTPEAAFEREGLRGSRAYAAEHAGALRAVIVVDLVGRRGLRLRRDFSADAGLWRRLRAASERAGAEQTFPDDTQTDVLDDHTPFLRRGVPAVTLLEFDPPCFHRRCDDLSRIDPKSLDAVGETLVELLRRPLR